jgi:uncharacterized protein YutE (UPF0331/DUF86 family)
MIRKEIIKHKIKEIDESLEIIKKNFPKNAQAFEKLGLIKDGIYKKIEFSIQEVIDICSVINTDLNLGIPSSEEDIIINIEKNKIISKNTLRRIRKMKAFRNVLVHRYGKVDDEIAFKSIKFGIKDFHNFIKEIEEFLKKH